MCIPAVTKSQGGKFNLAALGSTLLHLSQALEIETLLYRYWILQHTDFQEFNVGWPMTSSRPLYQSLSRSFPSCQTCCMVMLLSLSIRKADISIAGYNPLPVRRLSSTSHLDKSWDIQFLHFTNTRKATFFHWLTMTWEGGCSESVPLLMGCRQHKWKKLY